MPRVAMMVRNRGGQGPTADSRLAGTFAALAGVGGADMDQIIKQKAHEAEVAKRKQKKKRREKEGGGGNVVIDGMNEFVQSCAARVTLALATSRSNLMAAGGSGGKSGAVETKTKLKVDLGKLAEQHKLTDDEEKEEQLLYFAKAFSTLGQKKKKSFMASVKRHLSGKDEVVEFNKYQQDEDDDAGGDASIDLHGLKTVFRDLGYNPTEWQLHDLMLRVDLDGSGTLDVDEFLNLLTAHYSFCDSDPRVDLRPVFRMLDPRGQGKVRVGEIRIMMDRCNLRNDWGEQDTRELIVGLCDDHMVDFDTFVKMVTQGVEAEEEKEKEVQDKAKQEPEISSGKDKEENKK